MLPETVKAVLTSQAHCVQDLVVVPTQMSAASVFGIIVAVLAVIGAVAGGGYYLWRRKVCACCWRISAAGAANRSTCDRCCDGGDGSWLACCVDCTSSVAAGAVSGSCPHPKHDVTAGPCP